jgi:hypothetical protein
VAFLDKVKEVFLPSRYAKGTINTTNTSDYDPVNDFGGSRTTLPKFIQGGGGVFGALPKRSQRDLQVDEASLLTMSIEDLIDVLIDIHPDVSFAVWNFMRISDSGYTIRVENVEDSEVYEEGLEEIQFLIKRLSQPNIENFELSRDFDKVVQQLILSTVVRGACSLELVLTPSYDDVAFLAPVDPSTVDFKFENDRYVPYQDEETLSLDIPTFFYEGLDSMIDNPYGRSPILGALNTIFFQMQVLNDLKQVVHNQGYPRFDITILEEVLLNRMPITIRNNEEKKQKWLNEKLQEIIDMYNDLDPDDSFVHYDSVEISMAGGGEKGGAIIDPQKLMDVIDSQIMAGLKTLSTILGRRSTGNTESFAKMEIKLYIKGVEAIQKTVERILSRALTLTLNIKGMQGVVYFEFNPVEIRTSMETAQFEQVHLLNCQFKRDQGWIDQEEASMMAVGHSPVSEVPINNETPKNSDGSNIKGTTDEKVIDDTSIENEDEEENN